MAYDPFHYPSADPYERQKEKDKRMRDNLLRKKQKRIALLQADLNRVIGTPLYDEIKKDLDARIKELEAETND